MTDGHYVDVNGLKTYYEVHGEGEPLLLMHGGFCTVETLSRMIPGLAEKYRVVVPERRGHGRTPDVDGPITYEGMAADTIGLMGALGIESAHLVGYSDGANTAIIVAMERPGLVRKVVSIGGNFHWNGMEEKFVSMMRAATPETFVPMLVNLYKQTSPDGPEHFPIVFQKIRRMWLEEPTIAAEELGRVTAPTLVLVGDRDFMTLEHTTELFRSLPTAQLCVVPGSTHGVIFEKPDLVNQAVLNFLAA